MERVQPVCGPQGIIVIAERAQILPPLARLRVDLVFLQTEGGQRMNSLRPCAYLLKTECPQL